MWALRVCDFACSTSRDAVQGGFVGDQLKYEMASDRGVCVCDGDTEMIAYRMLLEIKFWQSLADLNNYGYTRLHPAKWNANDGRKEAHS